TVSYHLEALDADETSQYINHRLARASIGAPMEFPSEVTRRIHLRSSGVPRLINVIADATLVFGYGEERSEIDSALIEEVIADLDATGVLGPCSNPNRHESVVPVNAAAAETNRPAAGTFATQGRQRTAEDEKLARELAMFEQELKKREQEVTVRERELAEQRRVLADQYRLLKAQPQPASGNAGATAGWPPLSAGVRPMRIPAATRPATKAAVFEPYQARRRSSLWRRVKNTVLGIPEPALEDSL
ncbi:MAG: hypothetical protein ACRD2I_22870, partial [Vicinamibacterales bacterium]